MRTTRRTFPAVLADLEFTIDVPDGFAQSGFERRVVDFSDSTKFAPLTILSSNVAMALITIAARPAYESGSVEQWTRLLCDHQQTTITGLVSGFVGRGEPAGHLHPCILVEATQRNDETDLTTRLIVLEDGKRLLTVHAICPTQLWPRHELALENALLSVELAHPHDPTVPCVRGGPIPIVDMPGQKPGQWPRGRGAKVFDVAAHQAALDALVEQARRLIESGKYVEADAVFTSARRELQGAVALARLYREHLKHIVARRGPTSHPSDAHELEIFARAEAAAMGAYPSPHTQIEAERYEQGQAQDRADLVAIVGYDPKIVR